MEFEVSYTLDNEQQFWDELDDIVSTPCPTHTLIDNTLRSYLSFTTNYKAEYLNSDDDVARCTYKVLDSSLFTANRDYVRLQIVHCLLQEDAPDVLHLVATFLLFDGQQNEETFDVMNKHGAFPKLLELISERRKNGDEAGLHRLLLELLYEMSRIQRITPEELILVEDEFITELFQLIEELSNDVNDPYHYPVIKVLLVLNEQFMVTAHDPVSAGAQSVPLTNKVIKILSAQGSAYKTFGENIILLLNRESETSLQLLTLKLLYLLFTTPSTYEYFYTNDLRVLVDILIRNLLDLPEDASALRHTYLRVLYPLLAHTQLRHPPHYKREEVKKLLRVLMRGMGEDTPLDVESPTGISTILTHFGEVDETTRRLVGRCGRVVWLRDEEHSEESVSNRIDTSAAQSTESLSANTTDMTPASPTSSQPIRLPNPRREGKKLTKKKPPLPTPRGSKMLGMDIVSARASSLSVVEVAAQREKPGVMTPSRRGGLKPVPLPPPTRGWGRRKKNAEEEERKKRQEEAIMVSGEEPGNRDVSEEVQPPPTPGTKDDGVTMNGVEGSESSPIHDENHIELGEAETPSKGNGKVREADEPTLQVLVEKVSIESPFEVEAESEGR